ncbi:MAG: hypothetical protein Q7U88_11630 [Desulfocapsaceae bacterium]|nr:hypothetical protein [Desulfocapsaceae bacterium]
MIVKSIFPWQPISILFLAACLLWPSPAVAGAEKRISILSPLESQADQTNMASAQHVEPYINRVGAVSFATDLFLPISAAGNRVATDASFLGNALSVSFFPGLDFNIIVDSEARPQPNVVSMSGHLQGADLSTFSMTVTTEGYMITLQNLDTATVYRVVGNTKTRAGQVTEIDLTKMPPILYTPPIVPPNE